MSSRQRFWLLAVVLIIAAFLRFYQLTTTPPGLYPDEAQDGANAQYAAHTGQFKVYYPEDNGREGLYVNLLAIAFRYHILPETAPWSVRFPAAVAGTLTVLGIYLLVSELFEGNSFEFRVSSLQKENIERKNDSKISILKSDVSQRETPKLETRNSLLALLSSFFLATCFWHINFSRIGFRAILAPFFLVWGCWLLLKSFRAKKSARGYAYALIAGIVYSLGFYTYIAFRITPLLLLLFIPFFKKLKGFWKRTAAFLATGIATGLPIAWYFLKNPTDFFGRTSEIAVTNGANPIGTFLINVGKTLLMFNFRGDGNWRHNISGAPELWWPIGLLFIVGIIIAIMQLVKSLKAKKLKSGMEQPLHPGPFPAIFLFSWFILGILPVALSNDGIPHALRSILLVIPAVIFAAIGAMRVYEFLLGSWNRKLANGIAIVFLLLVAANGYVSYFITWAQNPNVPGSFNADYVAIGDAINALPAGTQKYVVVNAGGVVDYGIPVPAVTVMYITDSFVPDAAAQKDVNNIHYLLPNETNQIPPGTPSSTIFDVN